MALRSPSVLVDEDPIVERIEVILEGSRQAHACVEWSQTIYAVEIFRLGMDDQPNYRVSVFDGETKSIYVRGYSMGATWIECPHPNIDRGWWRLSPCAVSFLDELLAEPNLWRVAN